jgi:hypothetical protein
MRSVRKRNRTYSQRNSNDSAITAIQFNRKQPELNSARARARAKTRARTRIGELWIDTYR